MHVGRRTFLSAVAASGAAGAVARVGAAPAVLDASASPDWAWVRGQFDASPDWAHFSSFLLASHPRAVREAIARLRSALDENPLDAAMHEEVGVRGLELADPQHARDPTAPRAAPRGSRACG